MDSPETLDEPDCPNWPLIKYQYGTLACVFPNNCPQEVLFFVRQLVGDSETNPALIVLKLLPTGGLWVRHYSQIRQY